MNQTSVPLFSPALRIVSRSLLQSSWFPLLFLVTLSGFFTACPKDGFVYIGWFAGFCLALVSMAVWARAVLYMRCLRLLVPLGQREAGWLLWVWHVPLIPVLVLLGGAIAGLFWPSGIPLFELLRLGLWGCGFFAAFNSLHVLPLDLFRRTRIDILLCGAALFWAAYFWVTPGHSRVFFENHAVLLSLLSGALVFFSLWKARPPCAWHAEFRASSLSPWVEALLAVGTPRSTSGFRRGEITGHWTLQLMGRLLQIKGDLFWTFPLAWGVCFFLPRFLGASEGGGELPLKGFYCSLFFFQSLISPLSVPGRKASFGMAILWDALPNPGMLRLLPVPAAMPGVLLLLCALVKGGLFSFLRWLLMFLFPAKGATAEHLLEWTLLYASVWAGAHVIRELLREWKLSPRFSGWNMPLRFGGAFVFYAIFLSFEVYSAELRPADFLEFAGLSSRVWDVVVRCGIPLAVLASAVAGYGVLFKRSTAWFRTTQPTGL